MRDYEHNARCDIGALFVGASAPVLVDDQKPANSQEGYVPPLNLMMVATQLSHFKLWYAGAVENWPLAHYELVQIRQPGARQPEQRLHSRIKTRGSFTASGLSGIIP
jgi:hypothetical protein